MEILAALSPVVATDRFLFGTRPSLADFGLFAQLHILVLIRRPARSWRSERRGFGPGQVA